LTEKQKEIVEDRPVKPIKLSPIKPKEKGSTIKITPLSIDQPPFESEVLPKQ